MEILITRPLPDAVLEAAQGLGNLTVRDTNVPMTADDVRTALGTYDAILPTLRDDFSAGVFEGTPRCKMLANFGVGYNHIDVKAARAAGIQVSNTPGAVTDATADIALTLILMTCRRAGEGERLVRANAWDGWHPTQMLGMHVSGKTLGIVGMGRIGQAIAHRCSAGFGMQVVFQNRSEKTIEGATQVASVNELMAQSDVVVVAVPGGAETYHLINAEALAAMQPHAVLVNIARGDVIDETALVSALQAGQLAGAGLDVYEYEPKVPEALMEMENVVLLPHLGTAALEVRVDMGMMAVANLKAFVEGAPLPNAV